MQIETIGSPALLIGFLIFVALMLALDLGVLNRRAHVVSVKEAGIWSVVWVTLALAFNLYVAWRWGAQAGQEFLTGYLVEKALSVDNLFVFYMIFAAFSVDPKYQHRLLFWGILGALLLRAAMILGGTVLLATVHWIVYVFGALLVATGLRMLIGHRDRPRPEQSRVFRFIEKHLRVAEGDHGARLFVRTGGAVAATRLLLVLVMIELTDVMFAVDSIVAIFAITDDPFIVFTSNVFAILGMRSLYFVLAGVARRFRYLQPGLALVLVFVGAKMALSHFVHVPVLASLAVVTVLLGGSIVASLVRSRRPSGTDTSTASPGP